MGVWHYALAAAWLIFVALLIWDHQRWPDPDAEWFSFGACAAGGALILLVCYLTAS